MIIDLIRELAKPAYSELDDQQALTTLHAVTLTEGVMIPATTVSQLLAKLGLSGAIKDIADTADHPFRDSMISMMWSIGGNHPFNFIEGTTAGGGNLAMLDDMIANLPGLAAKLVQLKAKVSALANRKVSPFAAVTLADVTTARAVQLDGQWHELEETTGQVLQVQLNTRTPEVTHIIVQQQDIDGEWSHATALHGLHAPKPMPYRADLPFYGVARKLRWRCEYSLDAVVTVV